jgi:methionyl aminopeptidase
LAIKLKSDRELDLMASAGVVVADVLDTIARMVSPGVTTADLNAEAERLTGEAGAEALFKGVPGRGGPFPGAICASINEELVHGIPSPKRRIADGDIVSVDFGVRLAGYCADAAATFIVGTTDERNARLVEATRRTLGIAIDEIRPGRPWSAVAGRMQQYVEEQGFSVIREFVGHGIGKEMHEDPKVPNYVDRGVVNRDFMLEEGLVLAVEPMVAAGSAAVTVLKDGWTVVMKDRRAAAHFEHTLAVTAEGARILTARGEGQVT